MQGSALFLTDSDDVIEHVAVGRERRDRAMELRALVASPLRQEPRHGRADFGNA